MPVREKGTRSSLACTQNSIASTALNCSNLETRRKWPHMFGVYMLLKKLGRIWHLSCLFKCKNNCGWFHYYFSSTYIQGLQGPHWNTQWTCWLAWSAIFDLKYLNWERKFWVISDEICQQHYNTNHDYQMGDFLSRLFCSIPFHVLKL